MLTLTSPAAQKKMKTVHLLVSETYAAAHGTSLCARIAALGCGVELKLVTVPTQHDSTIKNMSSWDTEGRNVLTAVELAPVCACYVSEDVQFSWATMLSMFAAVLVAPSIRWLQISWVGIDFPLFSAALFAKPRLAITNAAGTNAGAVGVSTLAALLALHRGLHHWVAAKARSEGWLDREALAPRRDLAGCRVLVFGWGAIGAEVGRLCVALDMDVVGMRRRIDAAAVAEAGRAVLVAATTVNLQREIAAADYVVLACPLTDETRGLFDTAMLARMQRTACLLNVGRGAVVDENALAAALTAGELAGGYLDAFTTEPLPTDHALWSAPNLIISPHDAATCADNATRVEEIFVRNLEALCHNVSTATEDPMSCLVNCVWPKPSRAKSSPPAGIYRSMHNSSADISSSRATLVVAIAVLVGVTFVFRDGATHKC